MGQPDKHNKMDFKIKKENIIIISILLLVFSFGLIFTNSISAAGTFDAVNQGFANTGNAAGYPTTDGAPKNEFTYAWMIYINGLVLLMGLLFMILVIYAGWLWMSARGREEQVERAKNLIIQAVIGLGIIIGARIIVEITLTWVGTAAIKGA